MRGKSLTCRIFDRAVLTAVETLEKNFGKSETCRASEWQSQIQVANSPTRPLTSDLDYSRLLHPNRQFNHKPGAARIVRFSKHTATMLSNNPRHDRQSQTRAPAAGGKVRLEQPLKIAYRNPLAGIFDRRQDKIAVAVMPGADGNAALNRRIRERFQRVVDQIHEHSLHLFSVEHGRRQRVIQQEAKFNTGQPIRIEMTGLPDEFIQITRFKPRRRHARKARKFIDQGFQAGDLTSDRGRALFDDPR